MGAVAEDAAIAIAGGFAAGAVPTGNGKGALQGGLSSLVFFGIEVPCGKQGTLRTVVCLGRARDDLRLDGKIARHPGGAPTALGCWQPCDDGLFERPGKLGVQR